MSLRTDKVASEIREIVAEALSLRRARADELITVTRVEVTPDLRQAWVYLSFFKVGEADLQPRLDELAPFLQAQVAQRLRSKFTPKLQLRLDQSAAYAEQITRKLKRI